MFLFISEDWKITRDHHIGEKQIDLYKNDQMEILDLDNMCRLVLKDGKEYWESIPFEKPFEVEEEEEDASDS